MVIILDENVSLAPAQPLRNAGHEVIAVAETNQTDETSEINQTDQITHEGHRPQIIRGSRPTDR